MKKKLSVAKQLPNNLFWSCPVSVDGLALGSQAARQTARSLERTGWCEALDKLAALVEVG